MKKQLHIILIVLSLSFLGFISIDLQEDRWKAPDEAKSIKNPIKPVNKGISAKRGKKIFRTRCMICHGQAGKGDGAGGKALNPKPQNLTLPMVRNQTDGEIFWKITNGRNAMIKWGPILSESERWDLVNYIRFLE